VNLNDRLECGKGNASRAAVKAKAIRSFFFGKYPYLVAVKSRKREEKII